MYAGSSSIEDGFEDMASALLHLMSANPPSMALPSLTTPAISSHVTKVPSSQIYTATGPSAPAVREVSSSSAIAAAAVAAGIAAGIRAPKGATHTSGTGMKSIEASSYCSLSQIVPAVGPSPSICTSRANSAGMVAQTEGVFQQTSSQALSSIEREGDACESSHEQPGFEQFGPDGTAFQSQHCVAVDADAYIGDSRAKSDMTSHIGRIQGAESTDGRRAASYGQVYLPRQHSESNAGEVQANGGVSSRLLQRLGLKGSSSSFSASKRKVTVSYGRQAASTSLVPTLAEPGSSGPLRPWASGSMKQGLKQLNLLQPPSRPASSQGGTLSAALSATMSHAREDGQDSAASNVLGLLAEPLIISCKAILASAYLEVEKVKVEVGTLASSTQLATAPMTWKPTAKLAMGPLSVTEVCEALTGTRHKMDSKVSTMPAFKLPFYLSSLLSFALCQFDTG